MTNKIKTNEAMLGAPTNKTTVNIKKQDLGDTKVTSNIKKLGTDVNVNVVDENAVIEPQDQATIKYLSNVKDVNTGKVSQPFTIGDKRYQMIRGINPAKEVVMAVYCFDDMNDAGENMIHSIEEFEAKIAKPMLEMSKTPMKEEGYDFARAEREYSDKEDFIDYLNLRDLEGYKHFFVNIKTGEVTGKFHTTKEMMKSGQKLGPDEDYMDARTLKKFRFGDYFKSDVNEADDAADGTNVNKLQADVKKLSKLIKDKFSVALSKLNKPIEQVQFLQAMANEIGVPMNKLSTLLASFKDIAATGAEEQPALAESKKITKAQLLESIKRKQVIKTIKVKDIK